MRLAERLSCQNGTLRHAAPFITRVEFTQDAGLARASSSIADKIAHPQTHYETADDLLNDQELSVEEKKKALDVWEQDTRQLLTASSKGMSRLPP